MAITAWQQGRGGESSAFYGQRTATADGVGKGVCIALSSFSPLDGSCAGTDQG